MARPLSLVFLGLSLSSSWGNGHATNYRALLKALARRGHRVTFLERERPWYAANRDLPSPGYCRLFFYDDPAELTERFAQEIAEADAVVLGSYVPDGAAIARQLLERPGGPLGFYDIDTPVTLAALAAGGTDCLAADLVPRFDFYLSFTGGPLLERLERDFGARRARAFYCLVDPDLYRPTGEAPRWDLGYLGTYAEDRQPALERLLLEPARRLPHLRFVVAGPQYPAETDWPANVERIEHLPPGEHASFYSRLRFCLNVTRAEMIRAGWSPSVRLFEAAACGSTLLSDRWPGLDAILPEGRAVLTAETTEEVVAVLTGMPAEQARDMARQAREIVLAQHTGERRAQELEATIAAASTDRGE